MSVKEPMDWLRIIQAESRSRNRKTTFGKRGKRYYEEEQKHTWPRTINRFLRRKRFGDCGWRGGSGGGVVTT